MTDNPCDPIPEYYMRFLWLRTLLDGETNETKRSIIKIGFNSRYRSFERPNRHSGIEITDKFHEFVPNNIQAGTPCRYCRRPMIRCVCGLEGMRNTYGNKI